MGYNYNKCKCKEDKNIECSKINISYVIKNHNHEFLSSTSYEKDCKCVRHNHRISGTTGPAIECRGSHVHKIESLTDTFCDHKHKVCDTTGPAIYLPDGKHIHLIKGITDCADGHYHEYYFTSLIEDPTNIPKSKECEK